MNKRRNQREVITKTPFNKEFIYYASLFGAAFIISAVMLTVGIIRDNKWLIVYSAIIAPIFLTAALIFARYTQISKDTVYVQDKTLCIKRFCGVAKISIAKITKLTVTSVKNDTKTKIAITCDAKTEKHLIKKMKKEEIAHLKHSTFKY